MRFERIVGLITALNVDNTVGNIHSGTLSWTTRSGTARVNDVVDSGRKRSSPPRRFP